VLWLGLRGASDPGSISWDGHMAYQRCDSAIAGRSVWPVDSAAFCRAIHMCTNEAQLSGSQMERLAALSRTVPGCEPR
jgi:hypothetical protein